MPLDFSSGGTPVQAGVLDFSSKGTPLDFSSGGTRVKKTREQVMQEVGAAQGRMDVVNPPETQGMVGRIAGSDLANNIVSGLSLQPVMKGIGEVASIPFNHMANELYGVRPQPFVINRDTGELTQPPGADPYFGAGKPLINVPMASPEQMPNVSALPRVVAQLVQGLTTPENIATLPLAAEKNIGGAIASTLFAPQMIAGGLQSAPEIVTGETPQAREEAAYNTVINLLLGGKIGKGLVDQYRAQPIVPEVMPPLQRPVAPVGRQLNAPPLPFTEAEFATPPRLMAPGEAPTPVPSRVPSERPAGAARFGVDATGKAVDISQLTPKEQTELYRGPKEYVPREQYVRPGRGPVPIIGEGKMMENPLPNVVEPLVPFQNETRPFEKSFVPSKRPVEPSGGEVSFRAQAEAQGVPSARQSSLDLNRPQIDVPPTEFFVPREQKVLPLENPAYRAPKAAPTVEEYQRQQKRQNVEQGLTMEQPPMEPVAPEVGQYPEDIQSNRALSKLQRERLKLAVEQNKPVEVIRNILREGQEKNPPVAPPAKPTVAKMAPPSKNLNPLGDPMGTTYYGTPEDLSAYQGAQAKLKAIRESDPTMDKPETFTQLQEVMKENERVKNKYGGMPPQAKEVIGSEKEIRQEKGVLGGGGGIGGGIAKAIEKNREGGSVPNPFPFIVEKFKNKEKEKRGETFALSGPRIALDPKESGFKDVTKKVDAQQLWNRVKNKLTPAEKDIYEKSGVDKKIVGMGKVSPEEAAQMLQDGGVEVQTHTYGMEGKVSEAKKEYDDLAHWRDSLSYSQREAIDVTFDRRFGQRGNTEEAKGPQAYLKSRGFDDAGVVKAQRYSELLQQGVNRERQNGPIATSAYDTVSAFSTKEPMPKWTKTRSGKNVQRVDVTLPDNTKPGVYTKATAPLWRQDDLHENLPNTLGWAMIQYKDGPKGEKVAVVVEAQSRWGQHAREYYQKFPENKGKETLGGGGKDHPLLRDYNRLILKAAIDQARKEGATHIVVSDAESAMMTEGHDAHAIPVQNFEGITSAKGRQVVTDLNSGGLLYQLGGSTGKKQPHYLVKNGNVEVIHPSVIRGLEDAGVLETKSGGNMYDTDWVLTDKYKLEPEAIAQEPGMRLNYDTILPKIMEELSGEKGERVSMGEHKNAFEEKTSIGGGLATRRPWDSAESAVRQPRSNLVFRNSDGTPKTDVSGTMYKIPQTDKKFSLFEKDRPESVAGRLYMNPVGPMAKQAVKDLKKLGNGIKETTAKLKDYFKGAEDKVLPDLVFQNDNPLPDFQPKEIANKIFSQPFGSEKIPVLGRMMGGKARIRTPQDDAVATWYGERHGVGPAVASSVGEQIRGQIKGVFKVDEKGNLNVRGMREGQSLKMSDVFEGLRRDPLSYDLTVAQRKVFKQIIEPITKRMTELAKKYDIIDEVVDDNGDLRPYFPRIVTKHPKLEDKKNTSAFKTRAFNTEKEGWDRGYEYELDPEKRLVTGVERLYRAIANKRLATDPILGAKSEVQIKAEIKQAYAEKLATGEITQSKIDRIAEGIRTRGQVMQPILIRSIFDPETAKMLNKEFAAEQSTVRNAITSANSLMKATQLGFDLGVGQIQLLPLLYNNPKVWATAIYDSAKGMVNPEFFSTYVRANKEAVNELAQLGSSVGRLQEHMSGLGGETLLGRTPILGDVAQAFGRQFQTAMDVAKVEMWKALREGTPKKEWPKLVRSIETVLLSGRSESAMVPHGRALLERVALLAPSYYRGAVEHIASLGERGASGKVVRQSMGRFILGSAITFYAVAKAMQMSDEDIKEGFNPVNTSFMTWKVPQEDGSVVNIGFGGIFRSFLKLGGNLIKTSVEHPENWKSLSSEKNPLTRWYRGHAGPTPSMAWDAFSGEDFMGRETSLGTMAKARLPLLAQEAMRRPEEPKATALDFGASTFGLTTTSESFGARRGREQEQVAQKQFGKEFKNLTALQRSKVDGIVDAKTRDVPKGMTKERSRELAMKMSDEKVKKLQDGLSEGAQAWLKEKKVEMGGYQSTMSVGGKQVMLTKEEMEVLQGKMVSAYENTINKLMVHPNISKKEGAELQRYVNVHLENARKKVWGEMVREISKNAREKQGTKR